MREEMKLRKEAHLGKNPTKRHVDVSVWYLTSFLDEEVPAARPPRSLI